MRILPLVEETADILCEPLVPFDWNNPQQDPEELSNILIENMREHEGIGLTSNQIGLNLSAFAMIWDGNPIVVFNPEIIEYSKETTYFKESCLSYPGLKIAIRRSESIKAQFEVKDGSTKGAVFNGLSSRIFQHEMEHVRGREYFWEVSNFILKQAMKKRKHNLKKMRKDV